MVSSALNTLRGIPERQAQIYNDYLPQAAKIRQDIYSAGPQRLKQLAVLVDSATNALQGLQDSANAAELKVQAAAQPASADVSEAATSKVRYMLDNGMNLLGVCKTLVSDNDRAGFAALEADLNMFVELGKLGYPATLPLHKQIAEAKQTIAAQSAQLATRDELALQAEVQELWCMTYMRNNFAALFGFFQTQLLPSAVQGSFNRLESLYAWMGLNDESIAKLRNAGIQWDALPKVVKLLLVSDFDQVGIANLRDSGGTGLIARYDPASRQYLVHGTDSAGQWVETPLRGRLP